MNDTWDVAIVGGGLAGLAAAVSAADSGARVVLVDRNDRGGRAATDEVGRFRFNRGAHALYVGGPGMEVLRRFGVEPTGSWPRLRGARGRYGDRTSAWFGLKLLAPPARRQIVGTLAGMRRWRPDEVREISAGAWLDDLDLCHDARLFLEMGIRTATYAADPYRISADAALAYVRRGTWPGVRYLDGGWAQLVAGLTGAAARRNVAFHPGRAVKVGIDGDHVRVELETEELLARTAVLAAGTPDACAALLGERPPAWGSLGPASRIACLDVGLARDPSVNVLIALDRPLYLSRHAPGVVHVMRYLRPDESLTPDAARAELDEHARLAGIEPDQVAESRYLHEMVACAALPVPETGGMRGRPPVDTAMGIVFVAGDWVGPTGHLADASLSSGAAAGAAAVSVARTTGATIAV